MRKFETQAEFRARLARDAGITPAPTSRRVGSWIGAHTGDRVFDDRDPRHVGRVEAIVNGGTVIVKWDNGWKSSLPLRHIHKEKV